jgi:hypothetical protein
MLDARGKTPASDMTHAWFERNDLLPRPKITDDRELRTIPAVSKNAVHGQFPPGQNAIVGVNGSGKSTLINIALRCLTGPFNLPSATSDTEFGQVRARVTSMPKPDRQLFARRVADYAVAGSATLVVGFGEKTLEIRRRLSDLALEGCVVNDRLSDATSIDRQNIIEEQPYQSEISQCLGVASFFDALIVFYFLVFMLEDRRALVWIRPLKGRFSAFY